ncbi:HAD family hydrolase [Streptococcus acidominimus]|uniref:HAD family hydrolase n=1 Tax=Streptococcus acidominimus TaxID=1326 RepID=A0A4Y9FMI6_STRAI|nr:HAD family hydrolase [Streptococcus acidominimus]
MFRSKDIQFNAVKEFHAKMDGMTQEYPKAYDAETALHRADFKLEELVEFLYATSKNNEEFETLVQELHGALDRATLKSKKKARPETPLLGQVDALLDLLYFTYGSFALMGVDPQPIFDIVHQANMGKFFPDGRAHFDPVTHKILKPDHWEEEYAPEPAIQEELDRQLKARHK